MNFIAPASCDEARYLKKIEVYGPEDGSERMVIHAHFPDGSVRVVKPLGGQEHLYGSLTNEVLMSGVTGELIAIVTEGNLRFGVESLTP